MMRRDTSNSFCRILLDVFEAHGVREAVASPGSRNTPLLISLASREGINTLMVADERNAAFVALGMAMVNRRPVILTCTSGTALYNYAPAIAEAFYQHIPLIVITADRPFQWIDQYDSQTLHQPGALDKIVKKSFDIPVMKEGDIEVEWYVNRIANEAYNRAMDGICGPVHINIQLAPPLEETCDIEPSVPRIIRTLYPEPRFSTRMLSEITERMAGRRILVVAGYMPPNAGLNKSLILFSRIPGVSMATETLSNLHLPDNSCAIDTLLSTLTPEEKLGLRPDLVIQIGGAPVSRMLKDFCRSLPDLEVWTLGDTELGADCMQGLTTHIQIPPTVFFSAMGARLKHFYRKESPSPEVEGYSKLWTELRHRSSDAKSRFVDMQNWSELTAFRHILSQLPDKYNLFLSNGTAVRYAQLFTERLPHASLSNRGVSGIEGTTATAVGASMAYSGPTLLISGDMSFAYAPEALGIMNIPESFRIIVINNKGGGIFRFIKSTRNLECVESHFCADPDAPVRAIAESHGFRYFNVSSQNELESTLPIFFSNGPKALMEIVVPEHSSAQVLIEYMRAGRRQKSSTDQ